MPVHSLLFSERNDIPESAGVYAVYSGELCLYVGSSMAMYSRHKAHNRHPDFVIHKADRIEYELIENLESLRLIEEHWVATKRPVLNYIPGRKRTVSKSSVNRFSIVLSDADVKLLIQIRHKMESETGETATITQVFREAIRYFALHKHGLPV